MNELLYIISIILLAYFAVCTIYIATFSIASFFYCPIKKSSLTTNKSFTILIPSYKEDKVIDESVDSLLNQRYNKTDYEIFVISDGMSNQTNERLRNKGAKVLVVNFTNSSKAKSLKYSCEKIKRSDYILILDADNTVPFNYLEQINDFVNSTRCLALQTHRQSKEIMNTISFLDSAIEEMNNTIYRKGHNALNISSSLIGSGMVFEYNWFINNTQNIESTGEDKEFEELLLRQKHYIYYSNEIKFKDEKTRSTSNIKNQRRRWIATQFYLLSILLSNIFYAFKTGNKSYITKVIETLMLPKIIFLGIIFILAITFSIISPSFSILWWLLFTISSLSLYIAIPKYLRDKRLICSLTKIPFFFMMMFINLFNTKGASKKFIHTQHGDEL